jgi:glycerol-3-phosphate dehydrogenase (NAD(P)+)
MLLTGPAEGATMRVTVLGAGSWGTTVAALLCRPDHDVLLWARNPAVAQEVDGQRSNAAYLPGARLPARLRATADLERASRHAELLVVGVPTAAFRETLERVRPHLAPWIPVVSLSKGLERGTHLRMTEVVTEVLPGRPAAALTGPNLAREIMAGQAAASVIATGDLTVAAALQREVQRGVFRVYTHHDVVGCEVGGALKNVIAIATGMAQGLGVGDNTRAAVMSRGLAELTTLAVAMGGEPATLAGLAGLGDLVATCMSPQSRNRHVGEQLGLGRSLDEVLSGMRMVAEGVKTVSTVVELADRHGLDMPIARAISDVVGGRIRAADAYRGLVRAVPAGHESEPG